VRRLRGLCKDRKGTQTGWNLFPTGLVNSIVLILAVQMEMVLAVCKTPTCMGGPHESHVALYVEFMGSSTSASVHASLQVRSGFPVHHQLYKWIDVSLVILAHLLMHANGDTAFSRARSGFLHFVLGHTVHEHISTCTGNISYHTHSM
jgi:hypothetical protein